MSENGDDTIWRSGRSSRPAVAWRAREAILARVRAHGREEARPASWRSRRHFDDLATRFAEALTAVGGEVVRAGNLDEAVEKLGERLHSLGARRVVMNNEPPLSELDLPRRWPNLTWHIVGRTAGDLRAFCASADVGLSGASAALAETGTIVIESGPGRSRLATLLPPTHVALVPTSCLTTDLFTWIGGCRDTLPASLTLVSGPSKTADIEQTLAVGVHGPRRFVAILYDSL